MLPNARRITEMSPDSSFALPGTLSQHAMGVHFGPAGLARLDDNKRRENETAVVKASRETGEDVHKSRTLDIAILNVRCWGVSRRSDGMAQTSVHSQERTLTVRPICTISGVDYFYGSTAITSISTRELGGISPATTVVVAIGWK